MPERASRHHTSAWYLVVSSKNVKMCSCSACGLRDDRCPTKAFLLLPVAASDAGCRAGHLMSRYLGRTSAARLPVAGLKGLSMP